MVISGLASTSSNLNAIVVSTDESSVLLERSHGTRVAVVDWEFAQFGHRAFDLGQIVGDLYERTHFNQVSASSRMMQGFVDGYGGMGDDLAFRVTIHAGAHLVCWFIRRAPGSPFPFPDETVADAMRVGSEFMRKGWERDRAWLESSALGCLFKKAN